MAKKVAKKMITMMVMRARLNKMRNQIKKMKKSTITNLNCSKNSKLKNKKILDMEII